MLTRKKVLQSIKDLPETFSVEELLNRIIFLQKIETGLKQSENNQTRSTKEAKAKLIKWLK